MKLQIFIFLILLFCAGAAAWAFSVGSPVVGGILAACAVVNVVNFIRASSLF